MTGTSLHSWILCLPHLPPRRYYCLLNTSAQKSSTWRLTREAIGTRTCGQHTLGQTICGHQLHASRRRGRWVEFVLRSPPSQPPHIRLSVVLQDAAAKEPGAAVQIAFAPPPRRHALHPNHPPHGTCCSVALLLVQSGFGVGICRAPMLRPASVWGQQRQQLQQKQALLLLLQADDHHDGDVGSDVIQVSELPCLTAQVTATRKQAAAWTQQYKACRKPVRQQSSENKKNASFWPSTDEFRPCRN